MWYAVGDSYAEALIASRERQAETGALEVHAYDHLDVLAGQGTVGREFEQDAPEPDPHPGGERRRWADWRDCRLVRRKCRDHQR